MCADPSRCQQQMHHYAHDDDGDNQHVADYYCLIVDSDGIDHGVAEVWLLMRTNVTVIWSHVSSMEAIFQLNKTTSLHDECTVAACCGPNRQFHVSASGNRIA